MDKKDEQRIYVPEDLQRFYEIVGDKAYREVVAEYGGTNVYIPVDIYFTKEERNKMIFEEYKKGVGYIKLVRKFGLCESTIRKIVKKMKNQVDNLKVFIVLFIYDKTYKNGQNNTCLKY